MRIAEATEWVLAQSIVQGTDLKTDGYSWAIIVDDAVDKFDVDIDSLDTALCAALSLAAPPPSPLRPDTFEAVGLKVISDPAEVARYRSMRWTRI
jgi:hypothetical protein